MWYPFNIKGLSDIHDGSKLLFFLREFIKDHAIIDPLYLDLAAFVKIIKILLFLYEFCKTNRFYSNVIFSTIKIDPRFLFFRFYFKKNYIFNIMITNNDLFE